MPGPGWRKWTAYRQPGPGGLPLALRLSEGLGPNALVTQRPNWKLVFFLKTRSESDTLTDRIRMVKVNGTQRSIAHFYNVSKKETCVPYPIGHRNTQASQHGSKDPHRCGR